MTGKTKEHHNRDSCSRSHALAGSGFRLSPETLTSIEKHNLSITEAGNRIGKIGKATLEDADRAFQNFRKTVSIISQNAESTHANQERKETNDSNE